VTRTALVPRLIAAAATNTAAARGEDITRRRGPAGRLQLAR
jgi:hypothetical protein